MLRPSSLRRLEVEILVRDTAVDERLLLVAGVGQHSARYPAEEAPNARIKLPRHTR